MQVVISSHRILILTANDIVLFVLVENVLAVSNGHEGIVVTI